MVSKETRPGNSETLQEESFIYGTEVRNEKAQGRYTLSDYYALPEQRRAELIDGVLYDMASPSTLHQAVSMEIALQLSRHIHNKRGTCMVFTAPFDVQLDQDEYTMVQPDIAVICRRELLRKSGCFGAPDLVMEILSPDTSKKDLTVKLHKYIHAGVREYWVISPQTRQVIVYLNGEDSLSFRCYSFHDRIPVGIWDAEAMVDFGEILAQVEFLMEGREMGSGPGNKV